MTSIENGQALEFLNQNMHRNYPIQDTCIVATRDDNGQYQVYLPSSFLVDCQIIIPCETQELRNGIDTSRFFVSAVMHYTNSVQVIISYQPDGSDAFPCACSSAIVLSDGAEQYPIVVTLTPASGIPDSDEYTPLKALEGSLWIGSTANMSNLGSLNFNYADAQLNPTCIVKNLSAPITSLTVLDATGATVAVLTGDVVLQMDSSMELDTQTAGTLKIGVSNTWLQTKIDEIISSATGSAIKQINGQRPDDNGNFTITGLDCTTVEAMTGTSSITISNPCAKPCCGDDSGDLEDIRSSQKVLQSKVDRLSENLNTFINSINNVETRLPSLVASRK